MITECYLTIILVLNFLSIKVLVSSDLVTTFKELYNSLKSLLIGHQTGTKQKVTVRVSTKYCPPFVVTVVRVSTVLRFLLPE